MIAVAEMFGISGRRNELAALLERFERWAAGERGCRRYVFAATLAAPSRFGLPPLLEVARSDEHGEAVRRQILGDLKTDPLLAPVIKATGLSCVTNHP